MEVPQALHPHRAAAQLRPPGQAGSRSARDPVRVAAGSRRARGPDRPGSQPQMAIARPEAALAGGSGNERAVPASSLPRSRPPRLRRACRRRQRGARPRRGARSRLIPAASRAWRRSIMPGPRLLRGPGGPAGQQSKRNLGMHLPHPTGGVGSQLLHFQDLLGQGVRLTADPGSGQPHRNGGGVDVGRGLEGGSHGREEDRLPARPEEQSGLHIGTAPAHIGQSNRNVDTDPGRIGDEIRQGVDSRQVKHPDVGFPKRYGDPACPASVDPNRDHTSSCQKGSRRLN